MKPPPDPRTGNGEVALLRRIVSFVRIPAFWGAVTAIGAAFGLGIITPKRTADEMRSMIDSTAIRGRQADARLQAQIDSMNALRIELAHQHLMLEAAVTALIRMECVNPMVNTNNKILSGVVDRNGYCIR